MRTIFAALLVLLIATFAQAQTTVTVQTTAPPAVEYVAPAPVVSPAPVVTYSAPVVTYSAPVVRSYAVRSYVAAPFVRVGPFVGLGQALSAAASARHARKADRHTAKAAWHAARAAYWASLP